MSTLDREIDMSKGTREGTRTRRQRYKSLLWRARRAHRLLSDAVERIEAALTSLDVLPSRRAMAERAVQRLRLDVDALATVIANCQARVIHERNVPMADKKLSVSDPDVGFIAKGQRVPVIGYKPQVARSGAGFITGLLLPKGNASDAGQLTPMVDEVVRRTTVVPRVLSVDDGYASAANMDEMKSRGIEVISINGSKGRALTASADWNSDEYVLARDQRSAEEHGVKAVVGVTRVERSRLFQSTPPHTKALEAATTTKPRDVPVPTFSRLELSAPSAPSPRIRPIAHARSRATSRF